MTDRPPPYWASVRARYSWATAWAQRNGLYHRLLAGLSVIILCGALWVIYRQLRGYEYAAVWAYISALPTLNVCLALVLTALNFGILTGYDALALRYVNARLSPKRLWLSAFIGYSVSQAVGNPLVTGGSVRYWLYSRWGMAPNSIGRAILFAGVSFWLGFLALGGALFLFQPVGALDLPAPAAVLGVGCLLPPLLYVGAVLFGRPLRFWNWELEVPPLWMLPVQLGLAAGLLSGPALGSPPEPNDRPFQQAVQTVDSLRTVGDFRTALTRLYELNREHPQSTEVLWRYAIVWSDYGKAADRETQALSAYRQALTMADRALEIDPNSAWVHLAKAAAAGRAALLVESNKESLRLSRQVKDHADRAIELAPTLAPAYYVRGVWHSEVADLGFFKRVVVKTVYGGLPDASLERAVADLQQSIELEPHTYNHLGLGKVYMKVGRTEAAREQFQNALEVPPADPFAPQDKLEAQKLLRKLI